jgi:hypothetical protein
MNEGWFRDDYFILFNDAETASQSHGYGIGTALPGYTVIGLRGWDDLIVTDNTGAKYTVPAVPIDIQYVSPCTIPESTSLKPDDRFTGRIKWYVKPLVFGGDPDEKDNVTWVSLDQHAELVVWWNQLYRTLKPSSEGPAE